MPIYGNAIQIGLNPLSGFTYSGNWQWRNYKTNQQCASNDPDAVLALLSGGELRFKTTFTAQIFLVGGGGGGGGAHFYSESAAAVQACGGGGGYVGTFTVLFESRTTYVATIGAGGSAGTGREGSSTSGGTGGTTSINGKSVAGATGGSNCYSSTPGVGSTIGGKGGRSSQGSIPGSTAANCAFGETNVGYRFAGAGSGGVNGGSYSQTFSGGANGGGKITTSWQSSHAFWWGIPSAGTPNTGGGGAGCACGSQAYDGGYGGASGGSGIIYIRRAYVPQ